MATFGEHAAHEPDRSEQLKTGLASGGSMALALGGAAAIVLAIIGLSSVLSTWMLTIITIILGVAFILEGLAIAGRHIELLSRTGGTIEQAEIASGVTSEFLAGCAGLALGIIALLGVFPVVLSTCALIVFGSTLVFGTRSRTFLNELTEICRLSALRSEGAGSDVAKSDVGEIRQSARPVDMLQMRVLPANWTHVMVGLACVALGIVALAGVRPLMLSLVGMLVIGFALFLSGTAVATRFVYRLAQR